MGRPEREADATVIASPPRMIAFRHRGVVVSGLRDERSIQVRPLACYARGMTIKARVCDGRLVVDEPTTLPEGTELELLPLDSGDWLDDEDRKALHAALALSDTDVAAGRLVDATAILARLR